MVSDILNLFTTAVTACGSWFTRILDSTGMDSVYIVYVFIFLSISILLLPVIGGRLTPGAPFINAAKSDQAQRNRSNSSSSSGKGGAS